MLHALTPLHSGTPTSHILHLVHWCLWLQSRRYCLITRLGNPGVWYSRFPRTVTIEETVLDRLLLPRHSMESRVEHIPRLSEKSTYQSQSFGLRGRSQDWHIPRDYIAALRECRSGDTIFVFFFCLSSSSVPRRKKPVHFSEAPLSATASQETPPDRLALGTSRAYVCGLTGPIPQDPTNPPRLAYFNSCCLKVWPPVSLNIGAD